MTARERDVMDLVVAGLPNIQIGRRLNAAGNTVETHRGRVMQKMQAESLAQLVQLALSVQSRQTPPAK